MTPSQIQKHYIELIKTIQEKPELLADKMWRMENLYVINTKLDGKKIFKMNRAQRHFLENMKKRNIILKSRQLGFSTLITLWILDEVLFKKDREALSIAHVKEGMTDIFDKKAKFALLNLPDEIRSVFNMKTNSKTKVQFEFSDGSVSSFGVSLSGRSGTYHYVHISEYAKLSKMFPERAKEVITGTLPAVPFGGYVFVESTAEGATGEFYDMFYGALKNKERGVEALFNIEFYPHFYNWTYDDMQIEQMQEEDIIPISAMEVCDINWAEYQEMHNLTDKEMTYYYRAWISQGRDLNRLNQEYPTTIEEAFVSTGKPYFNMRKVLEEYPMCIDPVTYDIAGDRIQEAYNGPLMIWEKPKPGTHYVIGGDTAEGLAHGDYSVLTVIEALTKQIVAIYRERVPPDEFAEVAYTLGNYYNKGLLAIEMNKDGLWVNNELLSRGYTNLYFKQKLDDVTKKVDKIFGWRTDRQSRDTMLTELRAIHNSTKFYHEPLLDEMKSFVRNERGKPEAMLNSHDDVIMATAIAYQVTKTTFTDQWRNSPMNKKMSRMELMFMNRG